MAQASARNAKAAIEVFLRKVMGNLHLREMQVNGVWHRRLQLNAA